MGERKAVQRWGVVSAGQETEHERQLTDEDRRHPEMREGAPPQT